ncbi:carbohydrate-binding module family 18 protein, partial [Cucurbitaria berberidis CBS 394.84]
SSSAQASSTLKISPDARCGGTTKQTCIGSGFGDCCSSYGWCGVTAAYCKTGCQPGFGKC